MTELDVKLHLDTATANVRDVVCGGGCKHASAVECAQTTFLVFPYRGVYIRHVGRNDSVAESNQVLFFNKGEEYRISHPVEGGDACLSVGVAAHWVDELTPQEYVRNSEELAFRRQRLRIDARSQALVATLRYSLDRNVAEPTERQSAGTVGSGNPHAAIDPPCAGRAHVARGRCERRPAEAGRSRQAATVVR